MQVKSHKEDQPAYHDVVGDYRTGYRNSKTLLSGKEGAPNNFRMSYGGDGSGSDWTTPRHRHTFEQIRYTAHGDYVMKPGEVLPAGWFAYFPESVHYGPQIKGGNCDMMTLQYGGASGLGFWSVPQRKAAHDALIARGGKFEDGVYTWTDAQGRKHNQDAAEATEEQCFSRKVVYPEPRYNDIVCINPASFDWRKDKSNAGVGQKLLGTFTERNTRLALIRLDKGATLKFGTDMTAPEILLIKEGALTHENRKFDALTAIGVETEEQPVPLTAIEPTEIIYIKLPTF